MTIPVGTTTVADMVFSVDTILDEDCDLPMDLQQIMRAWPYLAADIRGRMVADAIASIAGPKVLTAHPPPSRKSTTAGS